MKKQIVINASKDRSRIAIVEDGELVELYVENPDNVRTIGNIYLGKVEKVLPTLRAGFVDIGEKQDAFLHFSDLTDNFPQLLAMSGNDVPGLDEPVLSLAPQKRIADDETEPDVEDTLEVESGDDAEEPSRNRSTRSRRSRGRGGRRRSEEEEEQEEENDERPRRGPLVLDLTTKPRTSTSRTAAKTPAAESTDAASDSDDEAPKKPTRARAKKKTDDTQTDDASEETTARPPRRASRKKATTDDADSPAADTSADEAPPKKRAPRKKKADATETPAETDEAPAPKTRASRAKKTEDAAETPAPKTRAPRKKKAAPEATETPTADASADTSADEETTNASSDEARTSRPRRTPRGRRKTDDAATETKAAPTSDASAEAPSAKSKKAESKASETKKSEPKAADEAAAEDRPRSRRRTRPTSTDDATANDAPKAKSASKPSRKADAEATEKATTGTPAEAPKRSRGTMTIDLTSSAQKSRPSRNDTRAPARDEATDDEPAETPSRQTKDEAAEERPRSRRRTRGRSDDAEATTTDAKSSGDTEPDRDTDDDATDERPRSRRSRRSRSSDEAPTTAHSDDASDDSDSDDDSGRGRSRRRSGGSSRSERTSDSDSPRDAPRGRSRGASDDDADDRADSGRGRSDRSRGDSSRGDRSKDGDSRGDSSRGGRSRSREAGERKGVIPSNEQLLKRGSTVIVKVTKEPISAKGSRVSTDISLAGRFLVLVPAADYVAVSKKIESARERKRLRTLAKSLKPDNCGVIVRTVAEGRDAKSLDTDLRLLISKWRAIEAKLDGGKAKAPRLLYEDVNMVSSIVRDLFSEDFDRILVDDPKTFQNVQAYVRAVAPDMADKVELHRGNTPVYRSVGIETQVEEAFSRRVNLKGGGYLFIETTEAMHVVDVNSGRAGRGKSQRENLIAVNVEAAHEVAKQLRLRDLGGIIVVDFIDLRSEADRKKVTNALKEGFDKDRAVTKLLPMSDFGLVQITRQRLRPSITAQPEGDDGPPSTDPAERAARAGAGEIAPVGGRRGRRDDDDNHRGLDADTPAAEERDEAPPSRSNRDTSRNDDRSTSRSDDKDRSRRQTRGARRDEAPRDATRHDNETRPDDSTAKPEVDPMTTPEAVTARLRAWLDIYRKTVEGAYRDRPVVVKVHPLFLAHLQRGLVSTLTRWRIGIRSVPWRVEEDASMDPLSFDVVDEKSGRSLVKKYTV